MTPVRAGPAAIVLAAGAVLTGCITKLPEVADPCATWEEPGLYSLKVDGRTVQVDVPGNDGPRTAVIAMHGAKASNVRMREVTRYDGQGREAGVVTVFPNGTGRALGIGRTWNADGCCPPAMDREEDVAWLDTLAGVLEERLCVDRPVAAGFSNGAMMALRWGCEGERAAGIVAMAGALYEDSCADRPVPVLLAHGLADPIVPFEGGTFPGTDAQVPSSDATLALFLERNGCADASTLRDLGDGVVCERFECSIAVERCTLESWDHRWPGGVHADAAGFDLTAESLRFLEESLP